MLLTEEVVILVPLFRSYPVLTFVGTLYDMTDVVRGFILQPFLNL